jgi:hypothetical protein
LRPNYTFLCPARRLWGRGLGWLVAQLARRSGQSRLLRAAWWPYSRGPARRAAIVTGRAHGGRRSDERDCTVTLVSPVSDEVRN